tara:strand:- start:4356 stop:4769 length:414 start_codon:yes stop_codon:yes gene_type:complete
MSPGSGSYFGLPIEVMQTASYPAITSYGTHIHTPPSDPTMLDEVWLYATNVGTAAKTLVIQFGNSGSAYEIVQELPSRSGLTLLIPGLVIGETGSLLTPGLPEGSHIAAYAGGSSDSNTSDILITGYVNRISGSAYS